MNNVTFTSAFTTNNFPMHQEHQQQLSSQFQATLTSNDGYIEKTADNNTSVNKNRGRGNVSRQLQKDFGFINTASNTASDYAVKTTVSGASAINEMLNALAEKKKANPEMQIALVSGGSVAGYAAALKLKNCGFHVIVSEKRAEYTRQNSFILKEEAFYSLTNLSPDGKLMNHLIDNKLMDIHKSKIVKEEVFLGQDEGRMKKEANSIHRFMNWLTNNDNIHSSAKIPDRLKKERETTEYLDLQQKTSEKKREPVEYADLAWPEREVVIPVDPKDWKYSNLGKIGKDNLGLSQFRNLEKGFNQYCLGQENIQIISAEIDLKETDSEDFKYSPAFVVTEDGEKKHIVPQLHFDLICIAEGANSKNAAIVSEQTIIPKVESWYQANYSGQESGLRGFFGSLIDGDKKQITTVQHMGRQEGSFANVSLGIEHDKQFESDPIKNALENAKRICETAGANFNFSKENMEFESQRIDVDIKRANTVMRSNVVIIGDSAGSGSPAGALGGSIALAAYPEMIERLVKHPDFKNPEKRRDVEIFFRKGIAQIVNTRLNEPSDTMRKLGFYSAEVNKQRIKNGVLALFSDVSDPRHVPNSY